MAKEIFTETMRKEGKDQRRHRKQKGSTFYESCLDGSNLYSFFVIICAMVVVMITYQPEETIVLHL